MRTVHQKPYGMEKMHIVQINAYTKGQSHSGFAPFFTPAAIYHNRTDVLCSVIHTLIISNEEVYIEILKTLYRGAQSLRTGVLRCGFVEI